MAFQWQTTVTLIPLNKRDRRHFRHQFSQITPERKASSFSLNLPKKTMTRENCHFAIFGEKFHTIWHLCSRTWRKVRRFCFYSNTLTMGDIVMKNLIDKIDKKTDEKLLSREQLAARWECCKETIKRMQNRGELPMIMFNCKNIRYQLSDVIRIEQSRYLLLGNDAENANHGGEIDSNAELHRRNGDSNGRQISKKLLKTAKGGNCNGIQ
jgi:hypothetical protein